MELAETRVADLRKGDTIMWDATRHNVIAAIREARGPLVGYTLRIQVPGHPVTTIRNIEPDEIYLRIA